MIDTGHWLVTAHIYSKKCYVQHGNMQYASTMRKGTHYMHTSMMVVKPIAEAMFAAVAPRLSFKVTFAPLRIR
jgi:hypothetical protein